MALTFIDIMIHAPEGAYARQDLIRYLAKLDITEIPSEKGRLLCYVFTKLDHEETAKELRVHLGEDDELKFFDAPDDIELPELGSEWIWFENVYDPLTSQ